MHADTFMANCSADGPWPMYRLTGGGTATSLRAGGLITAGVQNLVRSLYIAVPCIRSYVRSVMARWAAAQHVQMRRWRTSQ
jgi:hypothetical protein